MCIRSTLLYRCYPSVYSPVLSFFLFSPVVDRAGVKGGEGYWGGLRGRSWMGTSHAHWQTINNNNNEKSNKKNTSCALWETDLPHHQRQTSIHTRQLRSAQTFSFLFFHSFFLHFPHKATRSCSWSDLRRQRPSAVDVHCKELFLSFFAFFLLCWRENDPGGWILAWPLPSLRSSCSFPRAAERWTLCFVTCAGWRRAAVCLHLKEWGRGKGGEGEEPPRCPVLFERKTQIQSKRLFFLSFFLSSTFSVFDIEFF